MHNQAPVHYEVSLLSIPSHLYQVTATFTPIDSVTRVTLPSWIPGSYMVRDFAKNIIELEARDQNNHQCQVTKVDKQTWDINTSADKVTISYTVYAFDLSVRSAYINDEFAFFNGTSVFLQVMGQADHPHSVSINSATFPAHWECHTTMPKSDNGYVAQSYQSLIDFPVYIGVCSKVTFKVQDVPFTLVFSGDLPLDLAKMAKDIAPLCQHHLDLFGDAFPFSEYMFITLLTENGFGGLEHKDSTVLMFPRFHLPLQGEENINKDNYHSFLSLCSHELFHAWHVKRTRPRAFLNPDLGREVYSNQLWIYEGFTSLYDDLSLPRAGVISPDDYLSLLGKTLTRVEQNKGRYKQSVAESSFDAWTRFYQQDASATNNIVSYYTKGSLVALGLDLLLRQQSQGAVSLDTLMRILWQEYGRNESGTPDSVIADIAQSHFNIDLSNYLTQVVYGTQDVPLASLLNEIGLAWHTRPSASLQDKGGNDTQHNASFDFGITPKSSPFGVAVAVVRENTAGANAGLQVGDVVLAIDGYVATESLLFRLLNNQWTRSSLVVARDGRVLNLEIEKQSAPCDVVYLTVENEEKFHRWLGLD